MQPPALFTSLSRRPAAVTVTVRELLQKVQRGEIRIPKFQRPLRWKSDNVVQLFDSVWRGYPIGSLLFWKRKADAETIQVGGATISAPAIADAWWVIDGQQRTTALAAALLDLDHAGDTRWIVHFDPATGAFQPGPVDKQRVGLDIPVSILGDLKRFGRWLREISILSDDHLGEAEEAQQRLLDYSIPAYIVETEDEQALRGVFARLNSTGSRMRAEEVFQALLGAPSTDSKSSLDLGALQNECKVHEFGVPLRAEILKAILAMSGADPNRRLESFGATESLELVSKEDATEALGRTIHFLKDVCQIPHISLLPYPVVFGILCRWFHVHPSCEDQTLNLLGRWVWRGAATGTHNRAEVSKMRHQVRAIQPGNALESLTKLLQHVEKHQATTWELKSFDLRSARSRLETMALFELGPRDDNGLISIDELTSSGRLAQEIFAPKETRSQVTFLVKSAANRVVLASSHTGLSKEFKSWNWNTHEGALRSHLIDQISFGLLQRDAVNDFLEYRALAVAAQVDRFLLQRTGWNEPDTRPLSAYIEKDEH